MWATPAKRRRGRGRGLRDPRLAGDAGGDPLRLRRWRATGPCQSSGTLRTSLRGHRLQRVTDEQEHRAEQRHRGASTRILTQRCARASGRRPANASRAAALMIRTSSATIRAVGKLDRSRVEAGGDVGVVGGDDQGEAELLAAAPRSGRARGRRYRSRGGRWARRRAAAPGAARARGRSRRAGPRRRRAPPAGCRPSRRARPARAAPLRRRRGRRRRPDPTAAPRRRRRSRTR